MEDKRIERQKLAKFYFILIKSFGFTQFRLQITEIIDEFCQILSFYKRLHFFFLIINLNIFNTSKKCF